MVCIILKQDVKGEYAPRFYRMTGGSGADMQLAVESSGARSHSALAAAWTIDERGLRALRDIGYDVEQEPDFAPDRFDEGSIHNLGDGLARVSVRLQTRMPGGGMVVLPRTKYVILAADDAAISAEGARIEAERAKRSAATGATVWPASPREALRRLALRADIAETERLLAVAAEAMSGSRTYDAWKRANDALAAEMD